MSSSRRIALVSFDVEVAGSLSTFSYSVHKLHASLLTCPELEGAEVRVFNQETTDHEQLLEQIVEFEPTLLGASLYVWSLLPFRELAREHKRIAPRVPIVVGGPSARANVFDLEPYLSFRTTVDALVEGEGEEIIRQIAIHHLEDDWKTRVGGLKLWNGSEWALNASVERPVVDDYPSPYHLDIAPPGSGFIETFRGCPITCSFCQWGGVDLGGICSAEYLAEHLEGLRRAQVDNVLFLDAAFNLSPRAFRNLAAADEQVGVLKDMTVFGHLYPTFVKDMHLELFARMGKVHPAIGVQSFVPEVLERIGRPFDLQRFERVVDAIRGDYGIDIELIMGLPGDTPASFRRTVEKAIELADAVRIAFCMILPDALLDRARPHDGIEFDPRTFYLRSCNGWTPETLAREWEWVNDVAMQHYQQEIYGSWVGFRTAAHETRPEPATPEIGLPARLAVPASTFERLREAIAVAAPDFELFSMRQQDDRVSAGLNGPLGEVVLEGRPTAGDGPCFLRREGVDYSHRGEVGREGAVGLERVIAVVHADVRQMLADAGALAGEPGLVRLGMGKPSRA